MGTTVTALLRTGDRLALAHIGDSRAYLLREGALVQITRDHTFVQSLVDDGRITAEEAEHHPQRSVLMRVLSDVVDDVEPDMSMREARIGDRYLLCSDGLSGVVSLGTLEETMAAGKDPSATCENLVQLALRGGAPDNVTCIVADVVEVGGRFADSVPTVVGAASSRRTPRTSGGAPSSAERAAALTAPAEAQEVAGADDAPPRPTFSLARRLVAGAVLLAVLAGGAYGAYRWSQGQFFVGESTGAVAIYRGLPQNIGPLDLARLDEVAQDVPVAELPTYSRQRVMQGIVADGESQAHAIVERLREQVLACRAAALAAAAAPTTPTPTLTAPTSASTAGAGTSGATGSPGVATATQSPTFTATPSVTPPGTSTTPPPEGCGGLG
jgi:protein phosphatase